MTSVTQNAQATPATETKPILKVKKVTSKATKNAATAPAESDSAAAVSAKPETVEKVKAATKPKKVKPTGGAAPNNFSKWAEICKKHGQTGVVTKKNPLYETIRKEYDDLKASTTQTAAAK